MWLWLLLGTPEKIAPAALEVLEDTGKSSGLLVSIVSVWELARLVARGRRVALATHDEQILAYGKAGHVDVFAI